MNTIFNIYLYLSLCLQPAFQIRVLEVITKMPDKLDITKVDENGLTALHHSATRDNDAAAKILVSGSSNTASMRILVSVCPWYLSSF